MGNRAAHRSVLIAAALAAWLAPRAGPGAEEEARKELDRLLRILPRSEPWEAWLKKTGELPPDWKSLPDIPGLPDPLVLAVDGREVPVRTPADWARKRAQLLQEFHRYVLGTVPPPPGNVRARELTSRPGAGASTREVELEFGPDHRAKLHLELFIPSGQGPFPVFLTQDTHRAWALVALGRGYLCCVYSGCDGRDDTAAYAEIWPDHDWTKLARRAFAASRAIDHLITLPEVDRGKIAMTGHSRNGKMSLMASAMDERIAAVISSSSGAGGSCPYRFYSESQFGEGIELITRNFPDWLHPRLRFFAGSEQKLPIDNHELIALSAPRACLISTALNDDVESTWAIQEAYLSARRVYRLLGAAGNLAVLWRPGAHGTQAATIESYLDWLDGRFGRGGGEVPERLLHPGYQDFRRWSGEVIDPLGFPPRGLADLLTDDQGRSIQALAGWEARREGILGRIRSVVGPEPPAALNPGGDYGVEERYRATLLGRPAAGAGVAKKSINFGGYIAGDLYFPEGADSAGTRLPAVVWLHPISNASGYVAGYRRGEPIHLALAREGLVVLAFDQIGNGSRIEEGERFYRRFPRWSLLGKMVRDARSAVDALLEQPLVDRERIAVLGYSVGGMVALHAAAEDPRIRAVASVAGFTPFRLDTAAGGTGGIQRFSHWQGLLPRLGFFEGEEARVPYDFHEVLALIAPRPLLVVAPARDREASLSAVTACLDEVEKVYALHGAKDNLQRYSPDDYNRYGPELQTVVNRRLKEMLAR